MDTNLRFSMINRDLPTAMKRTEKDPDVAREIKYYEDNFSKVKTVDDLLNDYRLYTFVMKTMGMEDMSYAKGMVRKVLVEGTKDEKALANTLKDGRFRELAETFRFNKDGTIDGTFDWKAEALDEKVVRYTNVPGEEIADTDRLADYFQQKMQRNVLFSTHLLADPALYKVAVAAFDVPAEIIEGPKAARIAWFDENIDIEKLKQPFELKEAVERFRASTKESKAHRTQSIVDRYVRVTFESDEGEQNEGVRLALSFQRTAKDISSVYEILGSPALYQVVRTTLGLPENIVGTDVDRQAALIKERFDIEKFKDPEEVSKFVKKFVVLYDAANNTSSPTIQLFAGGAGAGVSADVLATFNSLKFGG